MSVTISTHRTEDDARSGRNAVEVFNGRKLADVQGLIDAELHHADHRPVCPFSGYARPDARTMFMRVETCELQGWPIVIRMVDAERRAALTLVAF